MRRLEKLGALGLVHAALGYNAHRAKMVRRVLGLVEPGGQARSVALFLCLLGDITPRELAALVRRLRYRASFCRAVLNGKRAEGRMLAPLASRGEMRSSQLAALLDGVPEGALLYYVARTGKGTTSRRVLRYLARLRGARPACGGADLIGLGLKPGPLYNRIFKELRRLRLDGELKSKREEKEYVRRKYLGEEAG